MWWWLWLACSTPKTDPGLSIDEISKLVRSDVSDREGWAIDVRDAVVSAQRVPDRDHICQVLAVIEQESGYQEDPAVSNLGDIVDRELTAQFEDLGPLAGLTRDKLLGEKGSGHKKTFEQRLKAVRTERELDRLFREIIAFHEQNHPWTAKGARIIFPRLEERLNPITTAGSMQVSVAYAMQKGAEEGLHSDDLRELLYTRRGGVKYGTLRLFNHEATYDKPVYRFADYNAGFYASRNAAFQQQLAELTGLDVTPDGDLLIWEKNGYPAKRDGQSMRAALAWRASFAKDVPEKQLREDLFSEKTREFEQTVTWVQVRESWRKRFKKDIFYARLPDITLDSPKLSKHLTTRWFAEKVDERYRKCLKR